MQGIVRFTPEFRNVLFLQGVPHARNGRRATWPVMCEANRLFAVVFSSQVELPVFLWNLLCHRWHARRPLRLQCFERKTPGAAPRPPLISETSYRKSLEARRMGSKIQGRRKPTTFPGAFHLSGSSRRPNSVPS